MEKTCEQHRISGSSRQVALASHVPQQALNTNTAAKKATAEHLFEQLAEADGSSDSGDRTVSELLCLKDGFSGLGLFRLTKLGASLILESLGLGITMVGSPVVNTFANVLLNISGTATDQAAMGLALVYNLWFYYGMLVAMYDKVGIDWSRTFGAKQYRLTRIYFVQGLIVLFTTFTFITLPAFYWSEELLVLAGSPVELSRVAAIVLKRFVFASFLETAAEMVKIFCMAQGHEQIFGRATIFSVIPSLLIAYWLVEMQKWGVVGAVYSKIIYEVINLAIGLYVLAKHAHPQTWGTVSFTDAANGLGKYFVDSFKYALGSYTEYLGYIISNYFVILTHDENQIAAFTIIESLGSIVYTLGEAFATIMRTRMNILIGKKYNKTAQQFAIFFYGLVLVFCFFSQVGIFVYRDEIAYAYTGNTPELNEVFRFMVLLFIFSAPADLLITSGSISMKTMGLIDLLVSWNLGLFILVNAGVCLLFQYLGLMNSSVAYLVIIVNAYILFGICVYHTLILDWTTIELQVDEAEEAGPQKSDEEIELVTIKPIHDIRDRRWGNNE